MTHTTYNGTKNLMEDQYIVLRNLIRNLTHRVDELEKATTTAVPQVGLNLDAVAGVVAGPDNMAKARAALAAKRAEKEQKPD